MQKLLLVIGLSLSHIVVLGQFYLGYSEKDVLIYAEKTGGIKLTKAVTEDGVPYVTWISIEGKCQNSTFFENGLVTIYKIRPFDLAAVQAWFKIFNRTYTSNGINSWQAYVQGRGVDIKYYHPDNNIFYFTLTLTKE